jgi:2-polyprenyl-3-methyl-5-hydroxy-6-metoxy-1,4-benzoquinol methylase
VVSVAVNHWTGYLATADCPPEQVSHELFLAGMEPGTPCPVHAPGIMDRLWRGVVRIIRERRQNASTLLDVACGGGDVALALVRRAARAGIQLRLTGVDMSSVALEVAQRQAAGYGLDADWQRADVLSDRLETCDVVHCSLFLHHLERRQAVRLLERMKQSARRVLIVQDLRRSPSAWLAAYAMCRLATRNPVVRQDGPISVAGAFTRDELQQMADEAGLADAQIANRWPFRMLMVWRRAR